MSVFIVRANPIMQHCTFSCHLLHVRRKARVSFVMSVCPSVRMEQLGYPRTDLNEIWYL